MRILLTVHQFLPEYFAGTEILTFKVAKELQKRGHEVNVFTGYPVQIEIPESDRFDNYTYEGIKIHRFYHSNTPMGGQENIIEAEYNNVFFSKYFRNYLQVFKPDVVHIFHLSKLSASVIDVCNSLKIPRIMTVTDFWLICPTSQLRLPDTGLCKGPDTNSLNCLRHVVEIYQPKKISRIIRYLPDWVLLLFIWMSDRKLLPKFWFSNYVLALVQRKSFLKARIDKLNKVLVPTKLMQEILLNNGVDSRLMLRQSYGLDLENIKPSNNKGDKDTICIGFIGTLYEHKGVHLLIEAIKTLPDIKLELKIYGDLKTAPHYVDKLYTLIDNDQRIKFCGTFPNHEIGNIFLGIDVLVVPSIWYENAPLVIYSAQMAQCPVIATNLGGMSEIIKHEINGLLFEKGNISELASCIRRLSEDRLLLKSLSVNAVRPKSIQEYANELEYIYECVVSEVQ